MAQRASTFTPAVTVDDTVATCATQPAAVLQPDEGPPKRLLARMHTQCGAPPLDEVIHER